MERLENREIKYRTIIHAEINAILSAGKPLEGCTLYVWPFMPCSQCASIIIQSGIRRVVTVPSDSERWAESFRYTEELFREAEVELVMRRAVSEK